MPRLNRSSSPAASTSASTSASASSVSATSATSAAPAFQVVTAERVPLSLPLAGLGERAIASSVDVILIVLFFVTLLFVYNLVRSGDLEQDFATATTRMALIIGGLVLAGIVVFDVVADVFFAGRTPGKRIAGLRVVDSQGRPPDLLTSSLRNLLRLVDMLPLGYGVGIFTMFFTGTRRLGDLVAGTVVVNERARGDMIVDVVTAAADGLVVTGVQLNDDEIVRLVELVRRGVGLQPALANQLTAATATALDLRLGTSSAASSAAASSSRARLAAAVVGSAAAGQGIAARVWRLHDAEKTLRAAITAFDDHVGRRRRDHSVQPRDQHGPTSAEVLDDAARAAGSELMSASRRGVPARWRESISLALLEVERRRRPLSAPAIRRASSYLTDDVPLAVWAERGNIGRVMVVFAGAAVVGGAISFIDLDVGRGLIGDDLTALVEQGASWTDAIARDGAYLQTAISVGVNNIGVGLRTFAFGILGAVGTLLVVAINGVQLGATFGVAVRLDTADTLARFIVAHGPVELSMICVAAAGGVCLGRAVIAPGQRTRIMALRDEGRRGLALLVFATVGFTAIAGVEGFVSPGRHFPLVVNVGVGVLTWLLFLLWARRGRR